MWPPTTYGYTEIADRVAEVLGVRPALSTLRTAAAVNHRTPGQQPRHGRITAGMPAPLTTPRPTERARFDADQIEQWLANHPRILKQRAAQSALEALRRGDPELEVVRHARASGLPWTQIVTVLTSHDHTPRTISGVSRFYDRRGIS